MDIDLVDKIKRIAIIALASDDELIENLVLKGGNAIDLLDLNDTISKTSFDLDYSIVKGNFSEEEKTISKRIEATLNQTFLENDYTIIDYKFLSRPKHINEKVADFWGGYKAQFKVVNKKVFDEIKGNINKLRNASIPLNPNESPLFELEFSKFEHIGQKIAINGKPTQIDPLRPDKIDTGIQ